jgi:hypothetical protein
VTLGREIAVRAGCRRRGEERNLLSLLHRLDGRVICRALQVRRVVADKGRAAKVKKEHRHVLLSFRSGVNASRSEDAFEASVYAWHGMNLY